MNATREQVFEAINTEREFQDRLWQGTAGAEGSSNPLNTGEFLVLLDSYVRKVQDKWVIEPKPEIQTLEIVRKIAAIAVNCLEQNGVQNRDVEGALQHVAELRERMENA